MSQLVSSVTYDRIRHWIDNPESSELSAADKSILERLDFAYDQLKTETPTAVSNRLQKKFEIKKSQSYIDIRNAQKLFNPVLRRDTDWLRNFIVENAMQQIAYAQEVGDTRAWQLARQDLIKVFALEKNDKEGIDPSMLGGNNYFIAININNKIEKLDYDKLHEMPTEKRQDKIKFLFPDVSEAEIIDLINS